MKLPIILLTNLRSIKNKFDDFCCQMYAQNPDIIICTETWLNCDFPSEAFCIPGYACFRTDRSNTVRGGGVAVWTKHRIKAKPLHLLCDDKFEVCAVQVPENKLLIVGMYMPPGVPSYHVKVYVYFRKTCVTFWMPLLILSLFTS